jgi:hypothetical protein
MAAMRNSQHVWVDGSMRNGEWLSGRLDELCAMFPAYRVAVFYITASEPIIIQRCGKRAELTGRFVPPEIIKRSMQDPSHALQILTPKVSAPLQSMPRTAATITV